MIHIVNGDVVGNKLKGIDGDILVWREMYDFGPLSSAWSTDELIKRRAEFFEEKLGIPSALFITNCQNQTSRLNELSRTDEVVLWFEHDRYDQTMMMYLISELSSMGFEKLSMVSIDQYPGIQPFYGLGQLTSGQLLALVDDRKEISNLQIQEAVTGWISYTSDDAEDIEKWIQTEEHSLPYLLQVMKGHKSLFPSIKTGLNEIEALSLKRMKEGSCLFSELFQCISEKRINDGLSDLHFSAILNELMTGPKPLLISDTPLPNYSFPGSNPRLDITASGLDVWSGKKNRLDLIGINWWVGGVRLH